MCPEEWLHPMGSLCPAAGGSCAPRPRHHHRLVQIPDHSDAANNTSGDLAAGSNDTSGDLAAGKSNSDASCGNSPVDACPHLTVASLHRTMA